LTSPSLLGRLCAFPADEAAWGDFVVRYGPTIYAWCRGWALQDADARDVTQQVLTKLATRMRTFRYDPRASFRRWLWTVTRHAWSDFHADRPNPPGEAAARLQDVAARDDLLTRLREAFDLELLEEAYARVRVRVAPTTWEAFRLTALDGRPGAEAAARLGMTVAAVFMAKSNVQKMLREEVRRLDPDAACG
jgi:RNA polymerase sigma-70 factor (ECF subfamily)